MASSEPESLLAFRDNLLARVRATVSDVKAKQAFRVLRSMKRCCLERWLLGSNDT